MHHHQQNIKGQKHNWNVGRKRIGHTIDNHQDHTVRVKLKTQQLGILIYQQQSAVNSNNIYAYTIQTDKHGFIYSCFFESLSCPLFLIPIQNPRRQVSTIDSGSERATAHRRVCGQYGVQRGSYPIHFTPAFAQPSVDGTKNEDLLIDAIFVATYNGT